MSAQVRGLSSVLREGAQGHCEEIASLTVQRGTDPMATTPHPHLLSGATTRVLTTLLHRQLGPGPDSVPGRGRGEKVLTQFLYVDMFNHPIFTEHLLCARPWAHNRNAKMIKTWPQLLRWGKAISAIIEHRGTTNSAVKGEARGDVFEP